MAITKEITHDAKGRGDYRVWCKEITIIKDNGVEVSKSNVLRIYNPDSEWSSEVAKVKTICDIHFTAAIKTAWATLSNSEKDNYRH